MILITFTSYGHKLLFKNVHEQVSYYIGTIGVHRNTHNRLLFTEPGNLDTI